MLRVQHRANGKGALLLTRFFLLNSLVFVTRTTVVGLTALPQPNFGTKCTTAQITPMTYWQAVREVCGSFPPKACGDLIFSGHVACAFSALFIFDGLRAFPSFSLVSTNLSRIFFYTLGGLSVLSCLLCRSHYTVDVVLGLYFAYFLSDFYLQRAEGVVCGGSLGAVIRQLEGIPVVPRPAARTSSDALSTTRCKHEGVAENNFGEVDDGHPDFWIAGLNGDESSGTCYTGYGATSSRGTCFEPSPVTVSTVRIPGM
jgi:hypothetical protein